MLQYFVAQVVSEALVTETKNYIHQYKIHTVNKLN